jgi:drug/metabolite transporter (DMT)-like permease
MMKRLWAGFSGVLLGLVLVVVGLGYLSDEPNKSAWISGIGFLLLVAGAVLSVRYVKRLRS